MWSGVYQQQINGRVWRYGQAHHVYIYHLVACGTTDIVMNGMASEKNTLFAALVKAGKNAVLEVFREEEEEEDRIQDLLADDVEGLLDEDGNVTEKGKKGKGENKTSRKDTSEKKKGKKRARNEEEEREKDGDRSPPSKKCESAVFSYLSRMMTHFVSAETCHDCSVRDGHRDSRCFG